MTTLQEIKKAGWLEVAETQKELADLKEKYNQLGQVDILSQTGTVMRKAINGLEGRIQGMVFILNMIK